MRLRNSFYVLTYVICLVIVAGCVSPTHHGRCHVDAGLRTRMGHQLGPAKSSTEVLIADEINWNDGLSEDEAIAIGLWNNPAYQELLADLGITWADLVEAAQLQNPQVTTMFPLGPKQWELALLVPLDFLWLRPHRVAAAELEAHRVAERLTQDGLNAVRDVRVAYVDWRLALERARLAEQGAKLRKDVARIAEARLEAGDVSELDVSAVRLDALVGESEAARAVRDADLARERLRFVLGLELLDVELKPEPQSEPPEPQFDLEQLVAEAISTRPDLRAVEMAVCAAQERAEVARRDLWQFMAMLPDLNSRGRDGFEAGPGLQMSLPIFHQNQGAIARAEADAERLRRQYVNFRDTAAMEVRLAYTQLLQAETDLAIWRDKVLPQASRAVESSQKAMEENTVSLLLVLEATRQLLNAQQREREAEAQLRRAIAELERSVGRRLYDPAVEIPDDAIELPAPQEEMKEHAP